MAERTERRKHPRCKAHIPVKFRKLREAADTAEIGAISNNISEGGIRFRMPSFIPMACRLILEMDIPMLSKPIKAISKVAWIQKLSSSDEYEAGNKFLEMSKKDQALFNEYVQNLTPEENPDSD